MWSFAAPAYAAAPQEELKELRKRIGDLRKELAAAEESRDEAADALEDAERAISETNRKLYELSGRLRRLNDDLTALSEKSRAIEESIRSQQGALSRLLYRMYVDGRGEAAALAFSGRNPGEVSRQLRYLTYLARARADLLEELQANLASLEALTTETREKREALAVAQAEQLSEKANLDREKAARAELLSRISRDLARQRSQMGSLKRDETRLANLVERLARLLAKKKAAQAPRAPQSAPRNDRLPEPTTANASSFRQLKGRLALPVRGELVNRFGSPRSGGGVVWKGVFIQAPEGDAVHAVADGRIVYSDWLRGFGNLLIIDHGDSFMSLYGNNQSLLKQVGEDVRGGDTVATVGDTGGGSKSGLYFEIRFEGKALDPLPWVSLK